jgi:hypothetical protein
MAWIAAVGGMGANAVGAEQGRAATVEGAKSQAAIEKLNRDYQRKIFDENIAQSQPYYDAGLKAQPILDQFRTQGRVDLSNNPLYQMQQRYGQEGLDMAGGVRDAGRNYLNNAMYVSNQEPTYQRALDLQRVGLGAAGEAGNQQMQLGNALASSYQRGSNAMMQGTADSANQRQSMFSNLAGQVGSMPAYYNYLRSVKNG